MRIAFVVSLLLVHAAFGADWNAAVLAAVGEMPRGGGYATTRDASEKLGFAASPQGTGLRMRPALARPSYCSGATYLVFLTVLERARAAGLAQFDPELLAPAMQADGVGVWGRWNANGPGTARLFYELGAGRNFTSWDEARPGDFLKIFWRDAVGSNEFGHSVIYLGTVSRDGAEWVRFWSSNKPEGFGEKAVPKAKIARALFSRLERPERLAFAVNLPRKDAYLAGLLERKSSWDEACRLTGAR